MEHEGTFATNGWGKSASVSAGDIAACIGSASAPVPVIEPQRGSGKSYYNSLFQLKFKESLLLAD